MTFKESEILQEDHRYVWDNLENKGDIEGSVFLITHTGSSARDHNGEILGKMCGRQGEF